MSRLFSTIGGYFSRVDEVDNHNNQLDESMLAREKEITELMHKSANYKMMAKQSLVQKNKPAAARFLKLMKETDAEIALEQGKISFLQKEKKKFKNLQKNEDIVKLSKQSRDLYDKKQKETNGEEDFSQIMADLDLQNTESNEVDNEFLLQAEKDIDLDLEQEIDADLADLENEIGEERAIIIDSQLLSHTPISALPNPSLNQPGVAQGSRNTSQNISNHQNGHQVQQNKMSQQEFFAYQQYQQQQQQQHAYQQQQQHRQHSQPQFQPQQHQRHQTNNGNSNSITYGQMKTEEYHRAQAEMEENDSEPLVFDL